MKNNNIAFLKEENLLTLFSQNNFIIPEIQREYVWGNNKAVIKRFLVELKSKVGGSCTCCHMPQDDEKINIGFLYSYKPDYVTLKHERFLDENIIDGQQRITTLFLLLFYCALKEDKKQEFLSLIRYEERISMCLNFKVRDLTRKFLLELVKETNELSELENIDTQTWFLQDYKKDISVSSMRNSIRYIFEIFCDETKYYNHLLNHIVFWHFKTEATNQGEELYITMNARGEELSHNEITKASLMLDKSELVSNGKKWEEWQQFFWRNRIKSTSYSSSDKGFNSFLNCIAGLENYLRNDEYSEFSVSDFLNTGIIENYIEAFKLLIFESENFIKECEESGLYVEWVNNLIKDIWKIHNSSSINWLSDYTDNNRSVERRHMVYIWPILYYIIEMKKRNKQINRRELFRVSRVFYLRYNNNDRRVKKVIKQTIDLFITNEVINSISKEKYNENDESNPDDAQSDERLKIIYLKYMIDNCEEDINKIESKIWEIEDHPLNLNATDLRGVNISHLIDLKTYPSQRQLEQVCNLFNEIFPDKATRGSEALKSLLLFYGEYWKDKSLSYYRRFDFSEWRKIIREMHFIKFFNDYKSTSLSLEEYYMRLTKEYLIEKKKIVLESKFFLPEMKLRDQLCIYSILLEPKLIWSQGEAIIIRFDIEKKRLFENENQKIFNSKGNFKGSTGNLDLWQKAIELYKDPLKVLKDKVVNL